MSNRQNSKRYFKEKVFYDMYIVRKEYSCVERKKLKFKAKRACFFRKGIDTARILLYNIDNKIGG